MFDDEVGFEVALALGLVGAERALELGVLSTLVLQVSPQGHRVAVLAPTLATLELIIIRVIVP